MPPKDNSERACEECIHYWACSRQCGEPMAQSSATGCECYETVKSSMAYYVGTLDGAKGKIPNRLRELAEADKDGRIRIIPESQNETCGHCYNFEREPGTKHGTCAKRPHPRDRYGKIDRSKQLIVSQSTQSCRLYMSLRSKAERALQEMEGKA